MFWNKKSTRDRPTPTLVARPIRAKPATKSFGLSLDLDLLKPAKQERSADPYNTSGSFDRTKNWERVSKR